jgi:hypothetical protein
VIRRGPHRNHCVQRLCKNVPAAKNTQATIDFQSRETVKYGNEYRGTRRKNAGETSRTLPDRPSSFSHNLLFMVWRRRLTPSPQSLGPGLHIYIPQRQCRPTLLSSIGVLFHSPITTQSIRWVSLLCPHMESGCYSKIIRK